VDLPRYVRPVHKQNGRTFYYFEKFRRTPKQWPRVRLLGEPFSLEFTTRLAQLPRLDAILLDEAWEWSFLDATDRRHPLPDPKNVEEFWKAVDKAEAIGRALASGIRRTFSALILEFKDSSAYQIKFDDAGNERPGIAESTQEQYERNLSIIEDAWGDDPVASLEAFEIQKVLDKAFRETPAAGRVFRSTLSRLIGWGIPRGYGKDNPVDHTETTDSGGTYSPWPPEAFDLFFKHVRVDLHLSVYSGLFTGQRKVDVLKMLRPLTAATEMPVVAQKTSARVPVQIHSEYRSLIDAAPVDSDSPNVALHLRADGVAWSYEGFKTAWGRELDKPEMAMFRERRWVFHGLRKNAVNMLLEVGCSEEQVSAIVGMSAAMVHRYSKEVSKFRLARSAMKMLESGWAVQRIHVLGLKTKITG
jgi:hypothetical protein